MMRWTPGGGSRNVEDRRGGGGMGMGPMGIGGAIVVLVLSLTIGRDFVSGGGEQSVPADTAGGEVGAPVNESPEEKKEVQFVSWVLDTTQATWARLMPQQLGAQWQDAKLVLYRNATRTGCGVG